MVMAPSDVVFMKWVQHAWVRTENICAKQMEPGVGLQKMYLLPMVHA